MARPLPVEYLLVDLPAAFPLSAQYTFKAHLHTEAKLFHVENRPEIGETQVCFSLLLPATKSFDIHCIINFYLKFNYKFGNFKQHEKKLIRNDDLRCVYTPTSSHINDPLALTQCQREILI